MRCSLLWTSRLLISILRLPTWIIRELGIALILVLWERRFSIQAIRADSSLGVLVLSCSHQHQVLAQLFYLLHLPRLLA